jgi:amidase
MDFGPAHLTAAAVWTAIGTEGMTQTMMYGDGYGLSRSDLLDVADGASRRIRCPKSQKMLLMLETNVSNK